MEWISGMDDECPENFTAVTTNTRPWGDFSLCWNLSFRGCQSTVSMVFSRTLTRRFPHHRRMNLTRIISNDDGVFNYFIKMKDYVVKTTRSLRDEWNSRNTLYSLRKVSQVVYLFDCMKTRKPWTTNCKGSSINSQKRKISHRKGRKFPLNRGCFRKWIL